MKLHPVIGVIGARQTGKSVLLRELIAPKADASYLTLDSAAQKDRAIRSPESFTDLESLDQSMMIIDEAQKAPDVFDAVKLHVDSNRRPGMYILSGSTEFSKRTGIRESLTGRIGINQLYPMTLAELHDNPKLGRYLIKPCPAEAALSLRELDKKQSRGGMPGLCFLRSDEEFSAACDVWLETTCYRDLSQVEGKFEGGLALTILSAAARLPDPTLAGISRAVRRDARVVSRYLEALCAILVLVKLLPHEAGVGKPQYLICDSGLAYHLSAPSESTLRTHVLIEALAHCEYAGFPRPVAKYYRNEKTSRVPVILSWAKTRSAPPDLAIQIFDGEMPGRAEFASLAAFAERLGKGGEARLLLLTQTTRSYVESIRGKRIEVYPLRG